jgi:hypothetical protein
VAEKVGQPTQALDRAKALETGTVEGPRDGEA